ncbi:MAG: hypothetical protein Q9170_007113 [Blastenia crenularia]
MPRDKIFPGSSHPWLVGAVYERLCMQPARCELGKFGNGKASVSVQTSIRDQDIFIMENGSDKINDSLVELLAMIAACKGDSAKSIIAQSSLGYFPYSRPSKKTFHRGAIVARLVANVLSIAGMNHAITVDLHAPPTQGFFGHPIDNLQAEPLIARWIRNNFTGQREAGVASRNPGGSKCITSLTDALKLSFCIIATDRRKTGKGSSSMLDMSGYLKRMGDGTYDASNPRRSETETKALIEPTADLE